MATDTSFYLEGAPLPANFRGTPQEFFEAMLARTKIVAPFGVTTFVVGSVEPTSNEGPWLKDGDKWYVWDDDAAGYVPVDITDSLPPQYVIQDDEPEDTDPPLWFKTNGNKFVAAYLYHGGQWVSLTTDSGTTANRPADPYDFQKYYDTDAQCEIWWERGAWRTVSGTKGDVKYVTWTTAEEAMSRNPGWEILGTSESNNQDWRGRVLSQATKNTGGGPTTDLSVGAGITKRAPGDTFGTETHTLTVDEMPAHTHTYRKVTDNGETINEPESGAPGAFSENQNTGSKGGSQAHNNLQPTVALWCLRKT